MNLWIDLTQYEFLDCYLLIFALKSNHDACMPCSSSHYCCLAIKDILNKAKEKNKKLPRVALNISGRGIIMRSLSDGCDDINMDVKIHR